MYCVENDTELTDPPFFVAYACASLAAWAVSKGRRPAAAKAAASATDCCLRYAWYQLPTSMVSPDTAPLEMATLDQAPKTCTETGFGLESEPVLLGEHPVERGPRDQSTLMQD